MTESYKVSAPTDIELKEVQYMSVGDYADVWMRKNIHTESTEEIVDGNTVESTIQVADEIHFQVDTSSVSESDIIDNFDKYWAYGESWEDESNLTNEEIIANLKAENESLKQIIVEISALI